MSCTSIVTNYKLRHLETKLTAKAAGDCTVNTALEGLHRKCSMDYKANTMSRRQVHRCSYRRKGAIRENNILMRRNRIEPSAMRDDVLSGRLSACGFGGVEFQGGSYFQRQRVVLSPLECDVVHSSE